MKSRDTFDDFNLTRVCVVPVDGTGRLCVPERAQSIPSRVLHLRQLPVDISEQEVLALAHPFGRVTKLITLKTKNQVGDEILKPSFPIMHRNIKQGNITVFTSVSQSFYLYYPLLVSAGSTSESLRCTQAFLMKC